MNKLVCFIINGLFTAFSIIFFSSLVVGFAFLATGGSIIFASLFTLLLVIMCLPVVKLAIDDALREYKSEKQRRAKLT